MIHCCDVGSLPYEGEVDKLSEGAKQFNAGLYSASARSFETTVLHAFLDKIKAGISIPAFPQFRDMSEMFLSTFQGLEKIKDGYVETGQLTTKSGQCEVAEVAVIEKNAEKIFSETGASFKLRLCITGPYTLASFFPYRTDRTFAQLGQVLSEIIGKSVFAGKHGKVALVSVDEPLFGMVDDPLIDRGTEGREKLLLAWESMMMKARIRNAETCFHLHCTSNDLFWTVKSLRIVETHVDDPLYRMTTTKKMLDSEDKMLKASIAIADFDRLIKEKLGSRASDEAVADALKNISKGTVKSEVFLEDVRIMKERLTHILERFGTERVMLAGPECGLRGFPTYACAVECLRRVSKALQ